MTDWLRRAGRGRTADGTEVGWTVAEGGRGRRWRWTLVDEGILWRGGLVELGRDGRLGRLELTSRSGLLTLHPEPDGSAIHGNVAGPDGVRGLAFAWGRDGRVVLAGDPFGSALLAGGQGPILVVDDGLVVAAGEGGEAAALELDGQGIPVLADAEAWPLED